MKNKLTAIRQKVLDAIKSSDKPINIQTIDKKMNSSANISTIYRALDYFEKNNLIQAIYISGIKYYYTEKISGHGHFLYCTMCNEIIEFNECHINQLKKSIEKKYDYSVQHHTLYFSGICKKCREYLKRKGEINEA